MFSFETSIEPIVCERCVGDALPRLIPDNFLATRVLTVSFFGSHCVTTRKFLLCAHHAAIDGAVWAALK